jgi:hypothetical protein
MMLKEPEVDIVSDGKDIYVVVDGQRIAKRGHPNTRHAGTWVTLVPGYIVTSPRDHSTVSIEFNGVRIH